MTVRIVGNIHEDIALKLKDEGFAAVDTLSTGEIIAVKLKGDNFTIHSLERINRG